MTGLHITIPTLVQAGVLCYNSAPAYYYCQFCLFLLTHPVYLVNCC